MDHEDDTSVQSVDDGSDYGKLKAATKTKLNQAKIQAAITNKTVEGNELSKIIPGYTAPMRLETKSLSSINNLSITQLRKQAESSDRSKYNSQISIQKKVIASSLQSKIKTPSSLSNPNNLFKQPTSITTSFHNKPTKQNDSTAGSKWFHMNPTPMTDSLKSDLALIRNRNYLDPKKFYKSSDSFGKVIQLGTVIEGSNEYYTSRLTKNERKRNFTEEVMADEGVASYTKRKFGEVQAEKERMRGKIGRVGGKKRR